MRVIVCGGREYTDSDVIRERLIQLQAVEPMTVIIHGAAPGADLLAGHVAGALGYKVEAYPADWARHGKAAGPIRNQEMLDAGADLVIAFPGGRGTKDMINRAEKAGVRVERIQHGVIPLG
ncbi:MAG: DUF2493 domain-containing protein [Ferrimicrobium sp.]